MPAIVTSVLDVANAGGAASIVEHAGTGPAAPPYVLAPIQNWLSSRLSQFIGYQQGTGPTPPVIDNATVQQIIDDLGVYVLAIPVPTQTLLAAGSADGLNLHATLITDELAELVTFCDLENTGTGRSYVTRLQIQLDRESVTKLNNFSWFLLTLMP